MADLVIRDATPADAGAIVDLIAGGALEPTTPSEADRLGAAATIEEGRRSDDGVIVAEIRGEVVGVCQLLILRHLHNGGRLCAEVESMHVRADLRSQGVGKALLEEVERRARSLGCYRIQLTSNAARVDAHRFYERNGYAPSHRGFKRLLERPSSRAAAQDRGVAR